MVDITKMMCTGGANDENDDIKMDQIDEIDEIEENEIPKTKVGFYFVVTTNEFILTSDNY